MYINMYILCMAKRYSIAEARANIAGIVREAEAGQEVELTRRGRPVAVVLSLQEVERLRGGRSAFADVYRAFLRTHALEKVGLEDDFLDGLRETGSGRRVRL